MTFHSFLFSKSMNCHAFVKKITKWFFVVLLIDWFLVNAWYPAYPAIQLGTSKKKKILKLKKKIYLGDLILV